MPWKLRESFDACNLLLEKIAEKSTRFNFVFVDLNGMDMNYYSYETTSAGFHEVRLTRARALSLFRLWFRFPILLIRCGPLNSTSMFRTVSVSQFRYGAATIGMTCPRDRPVYLWKWPGDSGNVVNRFGLDEISLDVCEIRKLTRESVIAVYTTLLLGFRVQR